MIPIVVVCAVLVGFVLWRRSKQPGLSDLVPPVDGDMDTDDFTGRPAPPAGVVYTPVGPPPAPSSSVSVSAASGLVSTSSTAAAPGPTFTPPEPLGWLAMLVAHGGATLGKILEYMEGAGSDNFLPYLYANYDNNDGASVKDGGYHYQHPELMPPSLPGSGPVFFAPWGRDWQHFCGGDGARYASILESLEEVYEDGNVAFIQWPGHGPGPASYSTVHEDSDHWSATPFRNEPGVERIYNDGTDSRIIRFPSDFSFMPSDGAVYRKKTMLTPTKFICPANAVRQWIEGTRFINDSGDQDGSRWNWERWPVTPNMAAVDLGKDRPIKIPIYYRGSVALRDEFWSRLVRWYHRAAWLVWAAETWRMHSVVSGTSAPPWWTDHTAAWGVGRAQHESTLPQELALWQTSGPDVILPILELVVKHTPKPGTLGSCGEQIVPKTMLSSGAAMFRRALLDMPVNVGSIDPPYSSDWVFNWGARRWAGWAASKEAGNFDLFGFIIQVETALCSAGFGSAVVAPLTTALSALGGAATSSIVCKVVNVALQNTLRMGSTGVVPPSLGSWGDVVGLLGEAADSIGLGSGTTVVPPQLWSAIKQAGAAIPALAGAVDQYDLTASLHAVQHSVEELTCMGWPYIDQAYGGLGLAAAAKTAAGNKSKLF